VFVGQQGVRLHDFAPAYHAISRIFNRTVTKVSKNFIAGSIAGRIATGAMSRNLNKAFRFFRYQGGRTQI
jgi:hypothetical protein